MKGNAPGNARGCERHAFASRTVPQKINRLSLYPVIFRRKTFGTSSQGRRQVRVKWWGKSPPPGWQHPGHGKPREVQDQIGGESWPGSLSAALARCAPLMRL